MEQHKQGFWNSYSARFDAIYGSHNGLFLGFINRCFRRSMKLRFMKTIAGIPESAEFVLDIGCGPGHYCIELANKNIPTILGIDFSEEMIALARKNAQSENVARAVDFQVCDFLEFEDERKYEYSILMGVVEYCEDPAAILRKAVAVTRKQAFVSFPVDGGLLAYQRKLRYKNRCYLKLYTHKELTALLSGLDVATYRIEKISRDYFVTLTI